MFTNNTFSVGNRVYPNVLVPCDHGLMIVNRFDDTTSSVGEMLLEHGNNSTVESDLTVRCLKDVVNPIVFDVGANIGTYATWMGKWGMDKNCKVYCFEPQRVVYQMLCGNMAINNIFNVYTHNIALGNEEKFIEVDGINYNKPGSSFAAFSLDGVERNRYETTSTYKERIKMTTIDNFMTEWNLEKVDFMKVDAEGLDIEVLEGAKNTLHKYKPDLLVEYLNLGPSKNEDTKEEGKNILASYLGQYGYNMYVIGHDLFATTKDVTNL